MDAAVVADLREQVALAHRLLAHYALGAYQGHVSARVPGEELLVTRGNPAVALSRIQPEDLMILDFDGNVVEASDEYPDRIASWALHTEIYKARPEIMAVTHTHQKWCTVFGVAGRDVLPVLHPPTASVAAVTWPVYEGEDGLVHNPEQGQRLAELLGQNVAVHLRNHGMVFVGTTVSKATLGAADAEEQAEVTWLAMAVGEPEAIEMKYLQADVDKRWEEPKPDIRDGIARGEWGNQEWLDDNPDASWVRGITL
jgi:ribulose-5-phosphate 4-epimerase/fuculose-1-phosphate aldolase